MVYVSTDKTEAVSMFITEQGSEEQAISITMLPRNIPPREVFLELPAGLTPSSSVANDAVRGTNYEAESFERSLPYVETLRTMLREVALGHIPSGYSLGSTSGARNIPSCKQTDLRFNFKDGQRLTGHNLDIYVGVVRNVGKFPVEFEEASCGSHNRVEGAFSGSPLSHRNLLACRSAPGGSLIQLDHACHWRAFSSQVHLPSADSVLTFRDLCSIQESLMRQYPFELFPHWYAWSLPIPNLIRALIRVLGFFQIFQYI